MCKSPIRVHCSQINHAFVSKAAMSSVCTLHPCRLWRRLAKKENKHRLDDHLSMCNCSGGTELDNLRSQVQDQSICIMVHIFAGEQIRGYVPRENEHRGAHFRGWCTNSLANLCAGARLRGGERIRCYTASGQPSQGKPGIQGYGRMSLALSLNTEPDFFFSIPLDFLTTGYLKSECWSWLALYLSLMTVLLWNIDISFGFKLRQLSLGNGALPSFINPLPSAQSKIDRIRSMEKNFAHGIDHR